MVTAIDEAIDVCNNNNKTAQLYVLHMVVQKRFQNKIKQKYLHVEVFSVVYKVLVFMDTSLICYTDSF